MTEPLACDVSNQTQWDLRIQQQQQLVAEIASQQSWQGQVPSGATWSFEFRDDQDQVQLLGSLELGPVVGLRLDRGDIPGDQQTVTLGAVLQPVGLYTQSQNGASQVLPPDQLPRLTLISLSWLQDGVA